MSIRFASFISFVLNPLFILVFLPYFLVYKSTHNVYLSMWWTGYTFLFLMLLGSFMIYAVRRGIFTDLDVSKREQRPIIFSFSLVLAVFYISGLYLFRSPIALKVMAIGVSIGIIILGIVNTKIKASIHIATISGLLVALSLSYGGYFFLLFLLIPVLAQARLSLKRHNPKEVITGGILGTLISLGIYWVLKNVVYY